MMLGGLNYRTLVTALPLYLTGDASAAQALAKGGLYSFLALLAGTLGQYLSGTLAQHRGAMPVYTAAILLMSALAASLALIPQPELGLPIAILLAICLFAQQPVENSLLAEGTSAQRRGLSYGMKFALTFGVGALGAPVVGLLWHYTDEPRSAFWLLTASGLTMITALTLFRILRSTLSVKLR
jgi:MFS family permease